tara:strand:- start:1457 stop:2164 length:708 start_codon:yes stop_codon:yes gene_type:complete
MIEVIPFESLGKGNYGWLDARYHFSFARYVNRQRMGYPPLRVWNDDAIQPHSGFPMHPHANMEIITFVRSGAVTHEDSLGNKGRTEAGEVQVMSAGSGIVHSEFNNEDEVTTLFQIWIESAIQNGEPGWETRTFPGSGKNGFQVLASGREIHHKTGVLKIYQDAALLGAAVKKGDIFTYSLGKNRHAYLVPPKGKLDINGQIVNARDGVYIKDVEEITFIIKEDAEIVLVDLPII